MRVFALLVVSILTLSGAQTSGDAHNESTQAVLKVMNAQVAAWNRGDIPTFVQFYAEDCKFVGKEVVQGRANVLARYRKTFPTPASMGKLTFSQLDVKLIDPQVATVTGYFHLDRDVAGGGPAQGIFSLVFARQGDHWNIVLDHTGS